MTATAPTGPLAGPHAAVRPGSLAEPLQATAVRETVVELHARISARFPTRGLRSTCADLVALVDAVDAGTDSGLRRIRLARTVSRVLMVAVALATLVALVLAVRDAVRGRGVSDTVDALGLIETTISDLVYAGVAVFFLWSVPERLQRGQLLQLLHRLRSTAHVIDMHQLSKDPEQLRPSYRPTAVSRRLDLTRDEMERYLDHCSEMLSLVGKTAALCAEVSQDPVILDTVNSIEQLTVGLSRKIWQKIANLPATGPPADRPPAPPPVAASGGPQAGGEIASSTSS